MRSRLPKTRSVASFFIVGSIVLFGVVGVLFHGPLFRYVSAIASGFSIEQIDEYTFLPSNVLAARLVDAERELARVRYQSVLYGELISENTRLHELVNTPLDETLGIGRVIAQPPQTHYDTLLVALPKELTVQQGDWVFFENVLLGQVSKTAPRTALVSLLSSGGSAIDARVGEPAGIVIMKGTGGGSFIFEVPTETSLSVGDAVVSTQNDLYLVATVSGVVEDADRISKTVYARAPVSFSDVRYVSFVRSLSTQP